jgi:hypothetical protein
VNAIFNKMTYNCTLAGACHDANGTAAGFSMTTPGWEMALVGSKAKGTGGMAPYMASPACAGMNYLDPGSNPATGLFLRKITANFGCGMRMPYTGGTVSSADVACIQTWANGLTAGTSM